MHTQSFVPFGVFNSNFCIFFFSALVTILSVGSSSVALKPWTFLDSVGQLENEAFPGDSNLSRVGVVGGRNDLADLSMCMWRVFIQLLSNCACLVASVGYFKINSESLVGQVGCAHRKAEIFCMKVG